VKGRSTRPASITGSLLLYSRSSHRPPRLRMGATNKHCTVDATSDSLWQSVDARSAIHGFISHMEMWLVSLKTSKRT